MSIVNKTKLELWFEEKAKLYGTTPSLTSRWEPEKEYENAKQEQAKFSENRHMRCGSCQWYNRNSSFKQEVFDRELAAFKLDFIKRYIDAPTISGDGFSIWWAYKKPSWWFVTRGSALEEEIKEPVSGRCIFNPKSLKVHCGYRCSKWEVRPENE